MPTAGRGKGKIALFLQNRASPLAQLTHTYKIWKCLMYPLKKKLDRVHPKGDQSWVFIGRTDFEAETPILWPPHVQS